MLNNELFNIAGISVSLGMILLTVLLVAALITFYLLLLRRWLPLYFDKEEVDRPNRRKIRRMLSIIFLLTLIIGLLLIFGLDRELYPVDTGNEDSSFTIYISTILNVLLVIQIARLFDWFFSKIFIKNYTRRYEESKHIRDFYRKKSSPSRANRVVQPVVYVLALLLIIKSFGIDDTLWKTGSGENAINFTLTKVLVAIVILLSARLISWLLTQVVLFGYYSRNRINIGSQYAINQLLQYFIYVIGILIALESLDVKLTVIWGGAAALLVGIGLGLQQTFNDLISGVILLFERSVEVGDVVEVDGLVGTVKRIGVRTSMVETRNNITVIVPNSKLITDNVVNWSHFDNKARFNVEVGVAYGSDTELVKKLLLKAVKVNNFVLKQPAPNVRFLSFGNSSLDFELLFWSHEFLRIEDVKSDIRFEIDRLFRENQVTIPFPQQDVWFKNLAEQFPQRPTDKKQEEE